MFQRAIEYLINSSLGKAKYYSRAIKNTADNSAYSVNQHANTNMALKSA